MEKLERTLLDYFLTKRSLSEAETRYFLKQIVTGLLFIHEKGYTHRYSINLAIIPLMQVYVTMLFFIEI